MKKAQYYLVAVFIICLAGQTVFAQERGTPQEWLQKGIALEERSMYEEAVNMYTTAIEIDPNYVDAYLKRGQAYRVTRTTEPFDSLADFDKALALDPANAEAYYQRGLLYSFILYNEDARTDMITAAGLGHKGAIEWLTPSPPKAEAEKFAEVKREAESEGEAVEEKAVLPDLKEYLSSRSEPMVHFDFDKSNIKKNFHAILDEVAGVLRDKLANAKILIAGHTDSTGKETYNEGLSVERADAVKSYLESKHGISPERIITKGYGPVSPIDTNETKEGRAKNRRA